MRATRATLAVTAKCHSCRIVEGRSSASFSVEACTAWSSGKSFPAWTWAPLSKTSDGTDTGEMGWNANHMTKGRHSGSCFVMMSITDDRAVCVKTAALVT